ncbi:MAG: non-ribosomal peptide synthetase, partial [Candidatus Dormibacteraeota bacterium]|nr:non-ribosomal peptide synthetase [Candidatus Dormibacteraeota bacterium]
FLPRSAAIAAAALGVLRAGAAYLPLDADWPRDRLAFVLGDAGCDLVLTDQELAEQLPDGRWQAVLLPKPPEAAGEVSAPPLPQPGPEDLAYVIYTSGSTGQPKGVEITHRSLLNLCHWHVDEFAVGPDDRATQIASPAFDAAVWEIWPYLSAGAGVHVVPEAARTDPGLLRDWMLSTGITVAFLPTPLAETALTLEWPEHPSLRLLLTGGDTLRRYPPAQLPFRLVNNYGPTECAVVATSGPVTWEGAREGLPSIGRPIANVSVHILDERLQPVPAGAAGELFIGGEGVARGYRNRPQLNAERFLTDPDHPNRRLYRTGDVARLEPDGEIAFLGRLDNQVQVRGHRVELDEVAAVLMRHPAVQAAVVTTWEPVEHDLRLAAYVVAPSEAMPPAPELRGFLESRLPEYMVPAAFQRLDALPLTSNGKVDRAALPALAPDRPLELAAPRTPVEERVERIAAPLLGMDRVGVDEDFFQLGGHSLLGTQLVSRVREAYGIEVPLKSLFDNPTVASISAEIERLLVERLEGMSEEEVERLLA